MAAKLEAAETTDVVVDAITSRAKQLDVQRKDLYTREVVSSDSGSCG